MRPLRRALLGAIASAALACSSQLASGQAQTGARVTQPPRRAPRMHERAPQAAHEPELTGALTAAAAATTAPPDPAEAPAEPVGIEDPSGRALATFHAALRRVQAGEGQARIVFYGASHVAADLFTGVIRQRLQRQFGEAGPGFVHLGKPWRWYRHAGITVDDSRGLRIFRIRARAPQPGIYGLAGAALDARPGKPALAAVTTRANGGLTGRASRFELYYLKQPRGGRISIFVDGKRVRNIDTASRQPEPGYAAIETSDAQHRFELRTSGDGPVRIFGASIERDASGVILDTLGVPGSRARDHLYWEDGVYREHLARRRPDLIVLAYGTNESGDDDVPMAVYDERLRRVLRRVREVAPAASCLLVGPSDRPIQNDDGTFSDRPLTTAIIDSQRRIAPEFGCGFFDVQRLMGGPMSMLGWVAAQPPLGSRDYVHFTPLGYERLADALHTGLLAGFDDTPPEGGAALAATPAQPVTSDRARSDSPQTP